MDEINDYKNTTRKDLYFAWMPKVYIMIIIVICDINMKIIRLMLNIYYDLSGREQIKSIHLKYALEDLIKILMILN